MREKDKKQLYLLGVCIPLSFLFNKKKSQLLLTSATGETKPLVKSVCESAPKFLF